MRWCDMFGELFSEPVKIICDLKVNGSVYSDRLFTWDMTKHNVLCEKHFGDAGQKWDDRDPVKIELFLQDYLGKKLKLVKIIKSTNASTGFPVYQFAYHIAEEDK